MKQLSSQFYKSVHGMLGYAEERMELMVFCAVERCLADVTS